VWFHSENNFNQGSSLDIDPFTLVATSNNLIVITINYRLGAFGFLFIKNTQASGNQAIYDQHLALKWIFENSLSFGGDKYKITIGGDYSGSISVGIHLIYKPSWSYFNNAILFTGNFNEFINSNLLLNPNEATNFAYATGTFLGCRSNLSTLDMFHCLLYSDVNSLNNISSYFYTKPHFVLDYKIFTQQPRLSFDDGNFKKCSILTGFHYNKQIRRIDLNTFYIKLKDLKVNNFNKIIELYKIDTKKTKFYDTYYSEIETDQMFKCSTYKLAHLYSKQNLNVYVYKFKYGDELKLFLAKPLSTSNESVQNRLLSEKLVDYLKKFIINNDPNDPNDNLKWLKFYAGPFNNRNILAITNGYSISNEYYDIRNQKCIYWNNLV
jgi:carboxylesterase type B